MATLKYFLKNKEAKNETLVNLIFQYGYYEIDPASGKKKFKFLKMSSGESINPDFWNPTACRARETKKFPQYPEFNSRLKYLENTVFTVYRKFINDGEFPTPGEIKKEVLVKINKAKVEKLGGDEQIGFFGFIEQLIEDTRSGKRLTADGKQFSPYTIKGYVTTMNHLISFQESRNQRIDFDSIDMDFYNAWVRWFYKKKKTKNTVGEHIKNLKVFMGEAVDKGLTKNMTFRQKKFKILDETPDTIHLNDDELDKMHELDLKEKKNLEKARDLFLLDCYIGLRISDFKKLKKVNFVEIDGVKCMKIRTQKSGEQVIVPLRKNAIQLLEKYDFKLPDLFEDQTMNRMIKQIGKLAGINDSIQVTKTIGGKVVTETIEKHNLITNHTARRSFATNYYNATKDAYSIMKITGHRTERSFLKYIRNTKEQNALRLASHPYFKQ